MAIIIIFDGTKLLVRWVGMPENQVQDCEDAINRAVKPQWIH